MTAEGLLSPHGMRLVSFFLDDATEVRLNSLATTQHLPRSVIIRRALEEFFKNDIPPSYNTYGGYDRRVTFRADEKLLVKLDLYATKYKLTRSDVIRIAILHYLKEHEDTVPQAKVEKMISLKHSQMETLATKIDDATKSLLDSLASTQHLPRSVIIRRALRELLKEGKISESENVAGKSDITIIFKAEKELAEEVEKYAVKHGLSKAAVIRIAILHYLKKHMSSQQLPQVKVEKPIKLW